MSRSRSMLLTGSSGKRLPTSEEVALRPELVRKMLETVSEFVDLHGLEHAVVIGITEEGGTKIYHSYGRDLPMSEVVSLLEDIAAQGREQMEKVS